MQVVRHHAFARAALVGNPSDGYNGKTISIIVPHFRADVVLYEWDEIEMIPSQQDQSRFRSLQELIDDVRRSGYYGGIRLVKATTKRFAEFCLEHGYPFPEHNFSIRYESNIPRQVGLAGSSAIVVATLRCLMEFFGLASVIALKLQAALALSVETDELGLPAGLQDRVVQVFQQLVYMDFTEMHSKGGYLCGRYQPLDTSRLPPLYCAFSADAGKPQQVRLDRGNPDVIAAMRHLAALTEQARTAILSGDAQQFNNAVNGTFDIRRQLYKIRPDHIAMVEQARAAGASANFAGSGGAIAGSYPDPATFSRLQQALTPLGCQVLKLDVGQGDQNLQRNSAR